MIKQRPITSLQPRPCRPDLIEFIKNIIDIPAKPATDWWDTISDVEKQSIEKGLSQIDDEKTTSHHIVRKKYEK